MVGKKVTLELKKFLSFGAILGKDEILLPKRYVPQDCKIGDELEVFIYTDSEDRMIATTLEPYGILGEIVCLEVVDVNALGVFLDLGIAKDLLMPCKNPKTFVKGQKVAVQIGLDKEGRLLASQNLAFQKYRGKSYVKMKAIPYRRSPLGFECIVEQKYQGMLFMNEVFEEIKLGESYGVQVKKTRVDGKIDLRLVRKDEAVLLLEVLQRYGGRLELTKDSDPSEIVKFCGMSKKAFKRALNSLAQRVGQDERGIFILGKKEPMQ